ncbi:MAG: sulfotransferase family protein [Candidatus Paceibacteria bacterium]
MGKIFGIGLQKTGTSSLGKALRILGYDVCGYKEDIVEDFLQGEFKKVLERVEDYDAFQDNPWPFLYEILDKKYPGSKFILTERSEKRWINSMVNNFGYKSTKLREKIYGKGHPKGNERKYLNKYKEHNKEVKNYFKKRPDDFLVVNWEKGDGWEKLCGFLGEEIPEEGFPHSNKGIYGRFKYFKKLPIFLKQKNKKETIKRYLNALPVVFKKKLNMR